MRCETYHLKDRFSFLGQDGRDPMLTTYLPYNMTEMNRQDQKRPCILLCPGGGYGMVSQREAEPIALKLLTGGYNIFVLTYSVKPHTYPVQLREVAAAMEMIYENADAWNCDTSRIAIMGFSAGGHLAAHYANCYATPAVREVFPESKGVQACILCYPVINAAIQYRHAGTFRNLSGHEYPLTAQEEELFSVDRHVTAQTPPTFIWHTAADRLVSVSNSLLYAQALAAHDVPFALHVYPAGGHGLATADGETNGELTGPVLLTRQWIPSALSWLQETL